MGCRLRDVEVMIEGGVEGGFTNNHTIEHTVNHIKDPSSLGQTATLSCGFVRTFWVGSQAF